MKNGANPHSITSACSDGSGIAAAGAGTIGQARAASTQAHQSAMTAIWVTPIRKKKRCGTVSSSRAGRVAWRAPGTVAEQKGQARSWEALAGAGMGGICGDWAVQRPASLTRVKIATEKRAGREMLKS